MTNISATDLMLQLYQHPQTIQTRALDMLQSSVLQKDEFVVDGNNTFSFLLEFVASMAAGITTESMNAINSLYPVRANKASELFRHMSDYDYVNFFSTPATVTLELFLERDYIIRNSVKEPFSDYRKVIIPAYSVFKIGEYKFGIHYPIEIRIRMAQKADGSIDFAQCNIACSWDNTNYNPLLSLSTNILEHRIFRNNGVDLLCIAIPVHQFNTTNHIHDAVSSTGFYKRLAFTDKFYAIRIFHYVNESVTNIEGVTTVKNIWKEMPQTLSDIVYDPEYATAKVSVLTDINVVEVNIPQVYFTSGKVGSKIKCVVYTCKGKVELDISQYTMDQFGVSFLVDDRVEDDTYSFMLKKLQTVQTRPLTTRIASGADGLTFAELKNRVIHDSTYKLLITPADIENYFKDQGFVASRYLDNLTNRIYFALKTLKDNAGTLISSGDYNTNLSSYDLHRITTIDPLTGRAVTSIANHATFKHIDNASVLILPSTIYKYNENINGMTPMDNDWMNSFYTMSLQEKIKLLNADIYTLCPFHIKLTTSQDTPVAGYYDLMDPKVNNVTFVAENKNINTQISLFSSILEHTNQGTTGYNFSFTIYKTDDIAKLVPIEDDFFINIRVLLRTKNSIGNTICLSGAYGGEYLGKSLIMFDIATTYNLTDKELLEVTSFVDINTGSYSNFISLNNSFEILFFIDKKHISNPDAMQYVNVGDIPSDYVDYVWLATQSLNLKLGEPIDTLFSNLYLTAESQNYITYPVTNYATYTNPSYKRYTATDIDPGTGKPIDVNKIGTLVYPLELLRDVGDVIVSAPEGTKLIPPACKLHVSDTEQHSTFLLEKYTATSQPTNFWTNANEKEESTPLVEIEIVDIIERMITELEKPGTNTTNYYDLRLQFIGDTCIDPFKGKSFMFVLDHSADINEAETIFTDEEILAGASAVYRRNTEYTNFDYTTIYYYSKPLNIMVPFDVAALQLFYNDVDSDHMSKSDILIKWKIKSTEYDQLNKARLPWIKTIRADSVSAIKAYWNDRRIIITTATIIALIQKGIRVINTYKDETSIPGDLAMDTIVWVNEIIKDNSAPLIGDMYIPPRGIRGGLYWVKASKFGGANILICSGPSKKEVVNLLNSINTFSGFMYVIRINNTEVYYNLLSFANDKLNLKFDTKDKDPSNPWGNDGEDVVNWASIDAWPWETKTPWINATTHENDKVLRIAVDENSSAKIAILGGSTRLNNKNEPEGIVTDENGDPIEDVVADPVTRLITHTVRMLHLDYSLTQSSEIEHTNYVTDVTNLIRSYFNILKIAKRSLLERTDLYYAPIRTIGMANYKGINGKIESRPLAITIAFRLHVEEYVSENITNTNSIYKTILNIVDKHIASGTISAVKLAEEINTTLSDVVKYVDVLGINGDRNLQTLILSDTGCYPHLKQNLVLNEDNSVGIKRGMTIEYSVLK